MAGVRNADLLSYVTIESTGKDKTESELGFVIPLSPVLMSHKSLDPDKSVYLVKFQFPLSLSHTHTPVFTVSHVSPARPATEDVDYGAITGIHIGETFFPLKKGTRWRRTPAPNKTESNSFSKRASVCQSVLKQI